MFPRRSPKQGPDSIVWPAPARPGTARGYNLLHRLLVQLKLLQPLLVVQICLEPIPLYNQHTTCCMRDNSTKKDSDNNRGKAIKSRLA